jgi:hypothetical protein
MARCVLGGKLTKKMTLISRSGFGLRTASSLSGRAGSADVEARLRAHVIFGDVVLTYIFALQA